MPSMPGSSTFKCTLVSITSIVAFTASPIAAMLRLSSDITGRAVASGWKLAIVPFPTLSHGSTDGHFELAATLPVGPS